MTSTVQQGPISAAQVIDVMPSAPAKPPSIRNAGSTRKRATSTKPKPKAPVGAAPSIPELEARPTSPKPRRTFVFYHGTSAGFRWLLPKLLRGRTQNGYVEFRPDGFSREGTRVERGKYVTADVEVTKALRNAIAEKRLRGVWEDDSHLKLRCEYCDFTASNNEQGRREMQAHNQVAHDRI